MSEQPHRSLFRNALSILGAGLTTAAAVVFVVLFLADLFGLHTNPYVGIALFLVLPAVFVLGLLCIPLGVLVERRRRRLGRAPASWPLLDLNQPLHRQRAALVVALTAANLVVVSLAAYGGVEYMGTASFCGQVCHVPMEPEFVAHQSAPHAKVECVACHVGPKASSAVRAKLLGVERAIALALDTYPRPIPPPTSELLPARDTCERCHWPEKLYGDVVRRVSEYASDATNTESVTTIQLHVGGGTGRFGTATGIHWHTYPGNEIEYVTTDAKRQVIPYMRLTGRDGVEREYAVPGVTAGQLASGERRRMDCTDCHNRPSHPIAPGAARAVDTSLARGELPKALPYVKREAVKVLEVDYGSETLALEGIAATLGTFYRSQPGLESQTLDVERAIRAVQDIYRRNVFPEMRVTFGTYPDNSGHVDSPGCFRCHDDEHLSQDGRKIGQSCDLCHSIE